MWLKIQFYIGMQPCRNPNNFFKLFSFIRRTLVITWHERALRKQATENSKMMYLNVQLHGLSGRGHPALNVHSTQDVKKLQLHLKFDLWFHDQWNTCPLPTLTKPSLLSVPCHPRLHRARPGNMCGNLPCKEQASFWTFECNVPSTADIKHSWQQCFSTYLDSVLAWLLLFQPSWLCT